MAGQNCGLSFKALSAVPREWVATGDKARRTRRRSQRTEIVMKQERSADITFDIPNKPFGHVIAKKAMNRAKKDQKLYNIVALQGDFCGTEVIDVGDRLLDAVSRWTGSQFSVKPYNISEESLVQNDNQLPTEIIEDCKQSDSVLLGGFCGLHAVNGDRSHSYSTMFKTLRKELGLYWQLNPAVSYTEIARTDAPNRKTKIDLAFVRELASGIYHGPQGREELDDGQVRAFSTSEYRTSEIEQIARAAFEIARMRSRRLTSVDLASKLEVSAFWREIVTKVGQTEYPDIQLTHEHADDFARRLIFKPLSYDVVVASTLLGDVLADVARGLVGHEEISPVAEFGQVGKPAVFGWVDNYLVESAEKVSPLGLVKSISMMLRYEFSLPIEADLVEHALQGVLAAGYRTEDMAYSRDQVKIVSCHEMGDLLLEELDNFERFKVAGNPEETGE